MGIARKQAKRGKRRAAKGEQGRRVNCPRLALARFPFPLALFTSSPLPLFPSPPFPIPDFISMLSSSSARG